MNKFIIYLITAVGLGAVIAGGLHKGRAEVAQIKRDIIAPAVVERKEIVKMTVQKVQTPGLQPPPAPPLQGGEREKFNLDVPFMTQAPFSDWDEVHNETCEEASVLMSYWFARDMKLPSKEKQEEALQNMIAWEIETFGDYKDMTVVQIEQLMHEYLQYTNVAIINHPSIVQIEKEISAGNTVIVPASGKDLKNPNFKNGGPLYHMLVIRGFDAKNFYTNDPGTRNGKNYAYTKDHLMEVMHDWNNGDVIHGEPRVMVVR